MKLGWIFGLLAAFCLSAQVYAADWELVTRDGREYVTLKSFCDFYHFQYPGVPPGDQLKLKNAQFSILLRLDSRESFINGTRYWLSFGIRQGKEDWLISRVDLVKLFEPVLRPHLIDIKKPVLGVVIDAGHGGSDNGAISSRGVMEKTLTLDTAFRLEKALRTAGIKTVMTRRSDVYVDLYERAQRAASYPGYIFVSIHFNSAGAEARGLETYCCSPRGAGSTQSGGSVSRADYQKLPGNDTDPLNVLLASEVHKVAAASLNPNDVEADRGVKRARFVVIKQNTVPAILVEGGFLSNRMESSVLATVAYRQKLADSIARGIQNYSAMMLPPEKRMTAPQVRPETVATPPKPTAPATTTSTAPVVPATPKPTAPATVTTSTPKPATPTPAPTTTSSSAPAATVPAVPETPPATATPSTAPATSAPEATPEKPSVTTTPSTTTPATEAPSSTESRPEAPMTIPEEKAVPPNPQTEPSTTIYTDHASTSSAPVKSEPDQP